MPSFTYRAVTADGRMVAGVEDVVSAAELDRLLAERSMYPLEVADSEVREPELPSRSRWASRQGDLTEAMATLAALLDAGLTLDGALEVVARGAARADLADSLETARQSMREGRPLADTLSTWPRLFSPLTVGLIRAGEQGGQLADATRRLAEHLERQRTFRARLLSALLYPLLLSLTGIAALLVLFLVVLPRFVGLLEDTGADLPLSTEMMLGAVGFLRSHGTAVVPGLVVALLIVGFWARGNSGRERLDALSLRIPLLGSIRAGTATARLARTLATLLSSGMSLVPSLGIAASAVGSSVFARQVDEAKQAVQRGESFTAGLRRSQHFPFVFIRLVEVGEQSGRLEAMLERSATLLESDIERRLQRLVAILEPLMILLFGLAIGFVALSLLQAIYGIHADAL